MEMLVPKLCPFLGIRFSCHFLVSEVQIEKKNSLALFVGFCEAINNEITICLGVNGNVIIKGVRECVIGSLITHLMCIIRFCFK